MQYINPRELYRDTLKVAREVEMTNEPIVVVAKGRARFGIVSLKTLENIGVLQNKTAYTLEQLGSWVKQRNISLDTKTSA